MYNASVLIDKLITLTGYRPDPNPDAAFNPFGDLLTASSGIYINDQHPLLTIENLVAIAPDFSSFIYPSWSALSTYSKGDIRTSSGDYYISLVNSNLNHAVSDTDYWRQTTPFNEWLREKTSAGIIQCINDWINIKFKVKTAANLLSNKQIIDAPGYQAEAIGDTERYINWRVVPSPRKGIVLTIDRVSIQMLNSQLVTIRLYKNGSNTALYSTTITGDGSSDVIWSDLLNWQLERGNFYYVSIDRNSIDATPLNVIANLDRSGWNYDRFPGTLPYAEIASFEHAGPGEAGWDNVDTLLGNSNTYGLNLSISARCDYTEFIEDQKSLFVTAIAKRVAINLLNELAFNAGAKINRLKNNIDFLSVKIDIDGHPNGRQAGLNTEYYAALNNITFDDKTICKECLPERRDKVKWGTV